MIQRRISDSPDPAATWQLVAAIAADIATGRIPILRSDRTEHPTATPADHHRVSVRLGQLTTRILATRRVATLAVIGGDTLAGFCEAMAWREFIALGEIEPGMAISAPLQRASSRPGARGRRRFQAAATLTGACAAGPQLQ